MSENMPDFIVPHDGSQPEIPHAERRVVSVKFSKLVSDLLLNHIEAVNHYEHPDKSVPPEDNLILKPVRKADEFWVVGVRSRDIEEFEPSNVLLPRERILQEISLKKVVQGTDRERLAYRLGGDHVVRRKNSGDMYEKPESERKIEPQPPQPAFSQYSTLDRGLTKEELLERYSEEIDRRQQELIPNARLEHDMGFNLQPIGLAELDGLTDMLGNHELTARRQS